MELSELENLLDIYNTKIKPFIENGSYDEAELYVSGLASRLLEEQMRARLCSDFSSATAYIPFALANAQVLTKLLKEKSEDSTIKRESRALEMSLAKYKKGLEDKAFAKKF